MVSLHVDPGSTGLIIGKGGSSIKALKDGLQTREDTKSNPWIVTGPAEETTVFMKK